ncbi:MAG: MarR family transcriptional regulator, partial [Acidimicrobiales bacterium]
ASKGFSDFRRSDTASMRILARSAEPIGRLGDGLGISRQAARKLADGLVARGYAELVDDAADARRRLVQLTRRGLDYHRALAEASTALNQEVRRLSASDQVAADTVLRAVLTDEDRRLAGSVSPPRPGRP